MNTSNTTVYPQVQAIEPTENMQWQQEKHANYQVGGFVLIAFGIGVGVVATINHLSTGFYVATSVLVLLGIVCHNLAAQFKVGIGKPEINEIHLALAGVPPYKQKYGIDR